MMGNNIFLVKPPGQTSDTAAGIICLLAHLYISFWVGLEARMLLEPLMKTESNIPYIFVGIGTFICVYSLAIRNVDDRYRRLQASGFGMLTAIGVFRFAFLITEEHYFIPLIAGLIAFVLVKWDRLELDKIK